jgi:cytochrome c biogenesis protein CcdA
VPSDPQLPFTQVLGTEIFKSRVERDTYTSLYSIFVLGAALIFSILYLALSKITKLVRQSERYRGCFSCFF